MLDASFLLLSILGRNITLQMWHVKKKKKKKEAVVIYYIGLTFKCKKSARWETNDKTPLPAFIHQWGF